MELHEALYTTRAMRRVRPDPIGHDIQARILDAAIRAPSGGNAQPWRFILVDSSAEAGAVMRGRFEGASDVVVLDALGRGEAGLEIREQIARVLEADGQADQAIANA